MSVTKLKVKFSHNKLKGRIVEICGTNYEFARLMGFSLNSLSLKLNNKMRFSREDIMKAVSILKIKLDEIGEYFFTPEV